MLLVLLLWTLTSGTTAAPRVATPAPPGTAEELTALVERARLRFVAKDAAGVLAYLADSYRSGGVTKADVRQQHEKLLATPASDHVDPAYARAQYLRNVTDDAVALDMTEVVVDGLHQFGRVALGHLCYALQAAMPLFVAGAWIGAMRKALAHEDAVRRFVRGLGRRVHVHGSLSSGCWNGRRGTPPACAA